MFLKWTTKPRQNLPYEDLGQSKRDAGLHILRRPDVWSLRAELVRSVRKDGKPRQEFVGHLGTVEVWATKYGVGDYVIRGKKRGMAFSIDVKSFWVAVILKLETLGDRLGDKLDRRDVMRKVAKVVRRWE